MPKKRPPSRRWDTKPIILTDQAFKEINKKFNKLNKKIQKKFKSDIKKFVTPDETNQFVYAYKKNFQEDFLKWLNQTLQDDIMQGDKLKRKQDSWFNNQVAQSYSNGAIFTLAEYNFYAKLFEKQHRRGQISKFSPLRSPYHIALAREVFGRNYEQLRGVTNEIATKMTNAITRAVLTGDSPYKLARELNKKTTLGKKRCKLIARTEIAAAQSRAAIHETQRLEEEEGLDEVLMRWRTRGDKLVRPSHRALDEELLTKKMANRYIGDPQCRCSVKPDWEEYFQRKYES